MLVFCASVCLSVGWTETMYACVVIIIIHLILVISQINVATIFHNPQDLIESVAVSRKTESQQETKGFFDVTKQRHLLFIYCMHAYMPSLFHLYFSMREVTVWMNNKH